MRKISLFIIFLLIIFITACGAKNVEFPKHSACQFRNGSIKLEKGIKKLDIRIDSGNLKIYCSDNNEIKYETKHNVRGNKSNDELQNLLKKYSIKSYLKNKTFYFSVGYGDKIKKSQDFFTDVELTIPRSITSLNINQKVGSVVIEDRFEGDIKAILDSVNSEVKSMNGHLIWKCGTGSFRLNAGKLSGDSKVETESGNISVKAECQKDSQYYFKTDVGNVDLSFPTNSDISINSFGTVKANQFTGIQGDTKVTASTKMGRISIAGY
jgi:hypothetical protein